MDIQKRIVDTEKEFNDLHKQRESYLAKAQEILTRMNQLQGIYNVLNDLLKEEGAKVNKTAGVVEVKAEEEKK